MNNHRGVWNYRSGFKRFSSAPVSTVFVDNLPNSVELPWFRKFFSNFGNVIDAYIPNKRSKVTGNRFGFIRFINNREATHAIEKSNGFWVGRRNLEVKIARYDRRNAVMNSDQRSSGIFRFASLVNHHKSHAAGFSTSSNHVEIDPSKEFDKRITINLQPSTSEWLWRSAIAELKAISSP